MNSIAIVTMLLAASAATMASSGIRVAPRIDITQPGESYQSELGVVNGLRSCGGPGRVVELRVEGCSGEGTCQVPGDDQRKRSELEFVPSEDIDALGLRFNLITDGQSKVVYERAISNSAVQGGETYIVNAAGGASKELQGQTVTVQYILYRVDDNNVEVCAEADFQIV